MEAISPRTLIVFIASSNCIPPVDINIFKDLLISAIWNGVLAAYLVTSSKANPPFSTLPVNTFILILNISNSAALLKAFVATNPIATDNGASVMPALLND